MEAMGLSEDLTQVSEPVTYKGHVQYIFRDMSLFHELHVHYFVENM